LIWGTLLAFKSFGTPKRHPKETLYPVSILKPLKGSDEGLYENLRSFFQIDYPQFELIFSVASAKDPAVPVVQKLIQEFPQADAKLLCESQGEGLNPKINNLIKAYELSQHELVLISDSNIRVGPQYLLQLIPDMSSSVGIITAVVAGMKPRSSGGWLEACYLNTFLSRWMILTKKMGFPSVVGKSMIFRKETMRRLGGLKTLGQYIAEDYMAGHAIQKLDLTVEFMRKPIPQFIGTYSVEQFWGRHLRWGRIRKSIAPLAFLIEPFFFSSVSGILGAVAFNYFWKIPFIQTAVFHGGVWLLLDMALYTLMDRFYWRAVGAWFLRECLAIPLWLTILSGDKVKWRGGDYRLLQGGLLAGETLP